LRRAFVTGGSGFVGQYDWVIAATGILHHPQMPDIEGLEDFEGALFHSAQWDHSVPLDGKRIGVIGNGSSGVQITGALAPRADHFSLFQRTAQWVVPVDQVEYDAEQRAQFREHPDTLVTLHDELDASFHAGFGEQVLDPDSEIFESMRQLCNAKLDTDILDPVLREKLRPDYTPACKRLVVSHNFYDSIQTPQAELVTEPIDRIEAGGIRTTDGRLHELDILVCATGFKVDAFVRPMTVRGLDGALLDDVWKDRPSAYLSVTVPGFPNFFMLNGPNSPVGNFSLIRTAEMECAYLMQLVDHLLESENDWACPSQEAATRFEKEREAAAKNTVWATGCRSWYLDDRGIPFVWPFSFGRFTDEMANPRIEDYAVG
jgi:cation diffusion facilitator CzcD-associated flavoprotein CzcO